MTELYEPVLSDGAAVTTGALYLANIGPAGTFKVVKSSVTGLVSDLKTSLSATIIRRCDFPTVDRRFRRRRRPRRPRYFRVRRPMRDLPSLPNGELRPEPATVRVVVRRGSLHVPKTAGINRGDGQHTDVFEPGDVIDLPRHEAERLAGLGTVEVL